MKSVWNGHYLDGKTAASQPAAIVIMPTGLEIRTEAGESFRWTFREIRQTQGSYRGEPIRLERGREITEAVVIPDTEFLTELHRRVPELGLRYHNPALRRTRISLTVLAASAAAALSAAAYVWGIPALVSVVTPFVPISWEENLGESTAGGLAPPDQRCGRPDQLKPIDHIVSTLTAPLTYQPYRLHVIVAKDPILNAFALPGGTIVVFRGLIERTDSADELAGVLAHEIQHILKRHTTRAMLEEASTAVLIAAVSGDASGAITYGLKSAQVAGTLRYSRRSEEEADAEGMKMLLAARVNPAGMIRFFERLDREAPELPAGLNFLSTHPVTKDRIKRLREIASASSNTKHVRLLPQLDWKAFRKLCST